ncbi:MAG: hypothetical protein A2075_23865 [Geobacteraceae bacterium GWC2_58_44]|nr:MAG: hypothetical protein A2075_23865 [Geobacteraceae bacterium GWC2_58_44]
MSFDISSLPEEILYDSIFVWEAIEEKLYQRGILVPSWDKQLQNALLESYFNSYSNNFFFPIHDFFTIKNYNKEESLPYYLNINLLNSIIVSCQQSALLDRVSPAGLLKLIYLDEFLTYKSLLEASLTESTCITTAVKHRKLLEKAIQYAGS